MPKINRTIEKDGLGTWSWTLGHDSSAHEGIPYFLSELPDLFKPQVVGKKLATYANVPGNQSIADLIMRGDIVKVNAQLIIDNPIFASSQEYNNEVIDNSTLERTKEYLAVLARKFPSYSSLRYLTDFVDEMKVQYFDAVSGMDTTLGLGRIVMTHDYNGVVGLSPPDGLYPSGLVHRSRVLGELMLFSTLYRIGSKPNIEGCRYLYLKMREAGWVNQSQLPGAIISIVDHGRRRMNGENIPPKTLETTLAIATGYAKGGFSAFERLLL